jgi:uncharacterized membrane protein YczE
MKRAWLPTKSLRKPNAVLAVLIALVIGSTADPTSQLLTDNPNPSFIIF